jgi:hypothetical protein
LVRVGLNRQGGRKAPSVDRQTRYSKRIPGQRGGRMTSLARGGTFSSRGGTLFKGMGAASVVICTDEEQAAFLA